MAEKRHAPESAYIYLVGNTEENFGTDLPSKREVLQCLFHHIRIQKLPVKESINVVSKNLLAVWNERNPDTKTKRIDHVKTSINKIYDKWFHVNKNKKSPKKTEFENEINEILDISGSTALEPTIQDIGTFQEDNTPPIAVEQSVLETTDDNNREVQELRNELLPGQEDDTPLMDSEASKISENMYSIQITTY